ncbi:hypothetical protein HYR99_38825 [Candidatus Poribacteria bacterium]|nr:hypothetical protein [Candidatus Poribacteria bacterium]
MRGELGGWVVRWFGGWVPNHLTTQPPNHLPPPHPNPLPPGGEGICRDGLTQWHPAFLEMGNTLDECASRYRHFCQKYTPPRKEARPYHWGSRLLFGIEKPRRGQACHPTGQMNFPFVNPCQVSENPDLSGFAHTFVDANRAFPTFG